MLPVYWHYKGNILYFKAILHIKRAVKHIFLKYPSSLCTSYQIKYNTKKKDTIAKRQLKLRGNDTNVKGCKQYKRREVKLPPCYCSPRLSRVVSS